MGNGCGGGGGGAEGEGRRQREGEGHGGREGSRCLRLLDGSGEGEGAKQKAIRGNEVWGPVDDDVNIGRQATKSCIANRLILH